MPADHANTLRLAIELSSRQGEIALGRGQELLGRETVVGGSRHDDDLMPAIDRLMHRCDRQPGDLDVVIVSEGPGGFTGLRIAVTTAKMFALALDLDIVAVSTADVVAESVDPSSLPDGPDGNRSILTCLAAKGDEIWTTAHRPVSAGDESGCHWISAESGNIVDTGDLWSVFDHPSAIACDHISEGLREVADRDGILILPAEYSAVCCWRLGCSRHRAGKTVSAVSLTPLYAREPEAVRLWRSRQQT